MQFIYGIRGSYEKFVLGIIGHIFEGSELSGRLNGQEQTGGGVEAKLGVWSLVVS